MRGAAGRGESRGCCWTERRPWPHYPRALGRRGRGEGRRLRATQGQEVRNEWRQQQRVCGSDIRRILRTLVWLRTVGVGVGESGGVWLWLGGQEGRVAGLLPLGCGLSGCCHVATLPD